MDTSRIGQSAVNDPAALRVVQRWLDAFNVANVRATLALSTADVLVSGPRWAGRGHPNLREWIEEGGLTLRTTRAFVRDQSVVLQQEATWHDAKGFTIAQATVAMRYAVVRGQVAAVVRHDRLEEALSEAGLREGDEVRDV